MKEKLLFAISFITHPVLLIFIFLEVHNARNYGDYSETGWIITLLNLLFTIGPAIVLHFMGFDLNNPTLKERRAIYLSYAIGFLLYSFLGIGRFQFEVNGVFLMLGVFVVQLTALFISAFSSKWSWHTSTITVFCLATQMLDLKENLLDPITGFILSLTLLIVVAITRYQLKAHTLREIIFGVISGAGATVITLFNFF